MPRIGGGGAVGAGLLRLRMPTRFADRHTSLRMTNQKVRPDTSGPLDSRGRLSPHVAPSADCESQEPPAGVPSTSLRGGPRHTSYPSLQLQSAHAPQTCLPRFPFDPPRRSPCTSRPIANGILP